MNSAYLKNIFLAIGLFLLLLSAFMMFSHIKYGHEAFVVSIFVLITGAFIPVDSSKKELKQGYVKRGNSFPNMFDSIIITGAIILGMLTVWPMKLWLNNFMGIEASRLIGYILSFGVPFLMIHVIRKYKTGSSTYNLNLENKRIIPLLILGSVVLLTGIVGPIGSLMPMPEEVKESAFKIIAQVGIYSFIHMVIAAPVLEELIFRGIVLDGLLKKYSPTVSIVLSSLLFGIAHVNPWQFVTGLIIGLFSGWVYYKTRSLLPSIIIHMAANLYGYITRLVVDMDALKLDSMNKSNEGSTNQIFIFLSSIIIVSICIYYLKKEFLRTERLQSSIQQQAIQR